MMNNEYDDVKYKIQFSALTKKKEIFDNVPYKWHEIEIILKHVFELGGRARINIFEPRDIYFHELGMVVINKNYKLYLHAHEDNHKYRLLEWWEPGRDKFEGYQVFDNIDNIQEEDKRTISSDINFAINIFKDFFENKKLSQENLKNFRSLWEPKPK